MSAMAASQDAMAQRMALSSLAFFISACSVTSWQDISINFSKNADHQFRFCRQPDDGYYRCVHASTHQHGWRRIQQFRTSITGFKIEEAGPMTNFTDQWYGGKVFTSMKIPQHHVTIGVTRQARHDYASPKAACWYCRWHNGYSGDRTSANHPGSR